MKVVVINAISVKEGGALVVLQNLLSEMVALRPDWKWHVATNSEARGRLPDLDNTIFHVYPKYQLTSWRVRIWYEICLPHLVKKVKADLLFSQTNYMPTRNLSCPTLLLVQHAGHFSQVFKRLVEAQITSLPALISWRLKGRWVRASVLRAQRVTVQTASLARCISEATSAPRERLCVIAHGTGQAILHESLSAPPIARQSVRLGYITKFGVQKNFSVLFAALENLKSLGIKPVLVLTLSQDAKENHVVFDLARQFGVEEYIENHGELSATEIHKLYRTLHLFVFPSLCESFGFPMLEAMAHGLPLMIAEIESNIEVAGLAGLTFAPNDHVALAALIVKLIDEPGWHQTCAQASLERAANFSWRKAAVETLALMDSMHTKHA